MHAAAVTSSIMQLSFIYLLSKFHLAPPNFKLSCVQLMISSGSPLNVLHFSSIDVVYILGLIAEHMYITIQHHVGVHNGNANGLSM